MLKILNKFKNLNIVQKTSIIAIFLVLLCTLADRSTAWYKSENSVVNNFEGHEYYVDIELIEPNWDSTGIYQAMAMQPGMDIFKDPRVVNISEDKCIVRMKIEIQDNGNNIISGERYDAILNALGTYNGSEVIEGINTSFTEKNGWYYYTGGSEYCIELNSGDTTEPLFTDVLIPILKSEYIGYFDSGFKINVIAEAIFSVSDKYSVETAEARFNGNISEEEVQMLMLEDEPSLLSLDDTVSSSSVEIEIKPTRIESSAVFSSQSVASGSALEVE